MEGPFAEGFLYRLDTSLLLIVLSGVFGLLRSLSLFGGVHLAKVR
jgi:hypothetical protein